MRIEIIASGVLKDPHYLAVIADYQKRMNWQIIVREINLPSAKKLTAEQTKSKEATGFLKHLDESAHIIALDEHGTSLTSEEFSNYLQRIQEVQAPSKIQFLIGGAYGLDSEVLQRCHYKLCFGKLTWPHMMVRVMLMEQLYRAQQIQAGHPYHKA